MTYENNLKCLKILKHYGVSPQLRKLAEECGEAVQAALKYDYRANEITKQALITEIADLEIRKHSGKVSTLAICSLSKSG